MFKPVVALTFRSVGIVAVVFDNFLASNPLVSAKLKIRYIIRIDVIKPTYRFKLEVAATYSSRVIEADIWTFCGLLPVFVRQT